MYLNTHKFKREKTTVIYKLRIRNFELQNVNYYYSITSFVSTKEITAIYQNCEKYIWTRWRHPFVERAVNYIAFKFCVRSLSNQHNTFVVETDSKIIHISRQLKCDKYYIIFIDVFSKSVLTGNATIFYHVLVQHGEMAWQVKNKEW